MLTFVFARLGDNSLPTCGSQVPAQCWTTDFESHPADWLVATIRMLSEKAEGDIELFVAHIDATWRSNDVRRMTQ
jgi:hypothetical protein